MRTSYNEYHFKIKNNYAFEQKYAFIDQLNIYGKKMTTDDERPMLDTFENLALISIECATSLIKDAIQNHDYKNEEFRFAIEIMTGTLRLLRTKINEDE